MSGPLRSVKRVRRVPPVGVIGNCPGGLDSQVVLAGCCHPLGDCAPVRPSCTTRIDSIGSSPGRPPLYVSIWSIRRPNSRERKRPDRPLIDKDTRSGPWPGIEENHRLSRPVQVHPCLSRVPSTGQGLIIRSGAGMPRTALVSSGLGFGFRPTPTRLLTACQRRQPRAALGGCKQAAPRRLCSAHCSRSHVCCTRTRTAPHPPTLLVLSHTWA